MLNCCPWGYSWSRTGPESCTLTLKFIWWAQTQNRCPWSHGGVISLQECIMHMDLARHCSDLSHCAHSKGTFQARTLLRFSVPKKSLSVSPRGWVPGSLPAFLKGSFNKSECTYNSFPTKSLFHGHIKHVVWESANFKSLWIVERKCLVQGVTGIRFLSDPLELLYFLSVPFKWCLGIKCANMRHELLTKWE